MNLGIPTDGTESDNFATIPDVSIDAIASRVSPQQVASGVTRGVQQLGGANVYSDGGNSQIIVKDTVPRVLMGNQATFGEGFYVSKPGIDATTNTNPANFIFNSNQDVFKVVTSNTRTVSPGVINAGTANTTTIAHGLSSTPAFLAYAQMPSGGGSYFGGQGLTNLPSHLFLSGGTCAMVVQASVDSTNLYLQLINPTGSNIDWTGFTWTFKYYILQETAN